MNLQTGTKPPSQSDDFRISIEGDNSLYVLCVCVWLHGVVLFQPITSEKRNKMRLECGR